MQLTFHVYQVWVAYRSKADLRKIPVHIQEIQYPMKSENFIIILGLRYTAPTLSFGT